MLSKIMPMESREDMAYWIEGYRYVFNFRALFLKRSCGKDFCKTLRGGDLKGFACETFLKDAFGGLCGTLGKPFAFTLSSIDRTYAQDICFAWSQDTELA